MALLWSTGLLAVGAILKNGVNAQVPTWPTPYNDDLEDIMFLNTGYRARGFSAGVTPCSAPPAGTVGRIASAEWLRTAFHDMARYNINGPGLGGLDASLAYELDSSQNKGPAFTTTLTTYEPFMGPYTSLADLIAMGTYTSVRSCGGAPVGVKYGRIDATSSNGDVGTPQPEDSQGSFIGAFNRMGFNIPDMIALTACGHTIGGVHGDQFPLIVTPSMGCPNNYCPMDTTDTTFDNAIAKEYTSNVSKDPLVFSAASFRYKRQSDFQVFNADGNATISKFTDAALFRSTCQSVLQRMIEVVPKTTTLSANKIVPYEAKPYNLQLYLQDGGQSLTFSGEIRIRTTNRQGISKVQLSYKDRSGGNGGTIDTKSAGTADGFDDSFTFYSFSTTIPASSSISSFTVSVTSGAGSETFSNNGNGFPIQDTLLLQYPQSCNSGSLTVLAAVRNTTSGTPTLNTVARTYASGLIPAKFPVTGKAMTAANSPVGAYALYNLTVPTSAKSMFNITLGSVSVPLQFVSNLGGTCGTLSGAGNNTNTNTTTPSTDFQYLGCYTDSTSSRTFNGARYDDTAKMTPELCGSLCSSYNYFGVEYGAECYCGNAKPADSKKATDTDCNMPCPGDSKKSCGAGDRLSTYLNSKYAAAATPDIGNYKYKGCFNDNVSARALTDNRLNDNSMTIQKCAAFCQQGGYSYFGTEYSSECYCGNKLATTSTLQTNTDCNMVCSGNAGQSCGGSDRIDLWSSATSSNSTTKRDFIPRGRTPLV